MKNVLHVIDTTGPGGAETIFVELATGLDPQRWHSVTAVPGPGWVHDRLVERGHEPNITRLHGAFDLRYLGTLHSLVRQHRIDLIQTHLLTAAVYGSLAGLLCRVPVVCTFHGEPDVDRNDRYRRAKFWILSRGATQVVFVSESLRCGFLASGSLHSDRTTVITNGIDHFLFVPGSDMSLRDELRVGDGQVLVGAVGNLRPAKAYDVFLKAAALLQRHSTAYRFVIVGEVGGPLHAELVALRDALGLAETVTFVGFRTAVHRVLRGLDVCLSTSSMEGFSLSIVEAMACGVPVVATRSGGPAEIITHDLDGLLVEVASPEQIAQAVERLRLEPETRARFASEGRKLVEARFTRDQMLRSYEGLYDRCIRRE